MTQSWHVESWYYSNYSYPSEDVFEIAPQNTTREPQVVTATINSALSRQREPESDPVRLQKGGENIESCRHHGANKKA